MCVNWMSNAEAAAAAACFVGYVVRPPLHRALARLDLGRDPDPVVHDVRTVGFLRALELDPVDSLGATAVARADERLATPATVEEHPLTRHRRRLRSRAARAARAAQVARPVPAVSPS